ncbi:MAG: hypothetical protein WD294_12190 [Phycisphaeraceae bacterium]
MQQVVGRHVVQPVRRRHVRALLTGEHLPDHVIHHHATDVVEKLPHAHHLTRLRERLGREPTDREIREAIIEYDKTQYADEGAWGLYRNCISELAELAWSDKAWQDVVERQSQVGYLDAAGPTNHGKFNSRQGMVAPGCAARIAEAAMALGWRLEAIEPVFIVAANHAQKATRAKVQPTTAWRRVRALIRRQHRRWAETGEAGDVWWA